MNRLYKLFISTFLTYSLDYFGDEILLGLASFIMKFNQIFIIDIYPDTIQLNELTKLNLNKLIICS